MVDFWVVHSIRAESSTLEMKYAEADTDVAEKYADADEYVAEKCADEYVSEKYLDQRIVGGMMVLPEQDSQSNETIH